jgi:hypothetical protein
MIDSMIDSMIDRLIDPMIDRMIDRLIDPIIDLMIDSKRDHFVVSTVSMVYFKANTSQPLIWRNWPNKLMTKKDTEWQRAEKIEKNIENSLKY